MNRTCFMCGKPISNHVLSCRECYERAHAGERYFRFGEMIGSQFHPYDGAELHRQKTGHGYSLEAMTGKWNCDRCRAGGILTTA